MSDKFNTSTVVKTCTTVGVAFGVSLYLYFSKGKKSKKIDDSQTDDQEDNQGGIQVGEQNCFPGNTPVSDSFLRMYGITDDDNGGGEEVNGNVTSFLHYDLYDKLENEQKNQKRELSNLGESVREAIEAVEKLQGIFSNSMTVTNSRLQKLEMQNPECLFFDNTTNNLPHIPEQNEFSLTNTPTNSSNDNLSETGEAPVG